MNDEQATAIKAPVRKVKRQAATVPPKQLAWTAHFEGRNFGARFEEISKFAKYGLLSKELGKTAEPGIATAVEKLKCLHFTTTINDLRSHGSLQTAIDRQHINRISRYAARETDHWHKAVAQLLRTSSPLIGKALSAYGEHIERVAAEAEFANRHRQIQTNTHQKAREYILKINRRHSFTDGWMSAYRLVNALNGCWLAHYCDIDPRHSVVDLLTGALDELDGKNESLARSLSDLGRYMAKPYFYRRHGLQDTERSEKELCITINSATGWLLDQSIEGSY